MDGRRIAIIGSPWLRDVNGARVSGAAAEAHEHAARAACEDLGRPAALSITIAVFSALAAEPSCR